MRSGRGWVVEKPSVWRRDLLPERLTEEPVSERLLRGLSGAGLCMLRRRLCMS